MTAPGLASPAVAGPLVRLLRPKQWIKNVLVFAAPAAAGVLDDPTHFLETLVALVAFCLAASGTYCLNDAADADRDRVHPTKRLRPVAAGEISVTTARTLGYGLLAASLLVSAVLLDWPLPLAIGSYVAVTTAYTKWLKHIAVLDITAVATGFVIRALAGAAATQVPVSDWFLIVASFGSLFMVSGKRSSELAGSEDSHRQRSVLAAYPPGFLDHVRSVSSGMTLLAYALFSFQKADLADSAFPWFELSIVPFTIAMLRYALRLSQGDGDAPEELVLSDRTLEVVGGIWVVLFMIGVYTA